MTKKLSKRVLAVLTAAMMALTVLPATAMAAEAEGDGAAGKVVTVNLTVRNYAFMGSLTADDGSTVEPAWTKTYVKDYALTVEPGENLVEALVSEEGLNISGDPSYISGYNGLYAGIGISSETQWGTYDMSGWLAYYNGKKPEMNGGQVGLNALGNQAKYTDYYGEEYDYIQLKNGDRINMYYAVDGSTLVDEDALPVPQKVKVQAQKKAFKVTTNNYSKQEITGYQYRYRAAGNENFKYVNSTKYTKKIKGLKANKKYYVRVRAILNTKVRSDDGSTVLKYYSDWSKAASVKTK